MKIRATSPADTRAVAHRLAALLRAGDVVVLSGELGAGKTTFAQGVAAALGVGEPVVSPTFTLVRLYDGANPPLAHVDVYRLETLQELHDLGFDELLDGDRIVLVEWGEAVTQALPADRVVVHLEPGPGPDERWITVSLHGAAWQARRAALEAALDTLRDHDGDAR
jgi:tRNA threonylcarbamoyladenosine biosynthesis protein TsaE